MYKIINIKCERVNNMITKVSCRPYASGISSTQNSSSVVNFGADPITARKAHIAGIHFVEGLLELMDRPSNPKAVVAKMMQRLRVEGASLTVKELCDAVQNSGLLSRIR